ncbi:hypothetical protein [Halorussus sp. AFM4]|uniref:hypothetical protein n=1 Tax=Halorussus sp. AFM4 TaxID=3421651 RepID=UPI003EBC7F4C
MGEHTGNQTTDTLDAAVAAYGPADAVLFETFDARLTDLEFYTASDGTLFGTTPDDQRWVRLTVTDRGLAATEMVEPDHKEDFDQLDQIDPAPEPDVGSTNDLSTRLRGD